MTLAGVWTSQSTYGTGCQTGCTTSTESKNQGRMKKSRTILKTKSLQFLSGGNGARLVFDTGVLTVGVRVTGNDLDYLTGTLDRIRENSAVRRSF